MRATSNWKQAAAACGLSLLMFSSAGAQTAAQGTTQNPNRETKQSNPAASNPSNTNRTGAAAGQAGSATRPGAASSKATGQAGQARTANKPVGGAAAQSADHQIAGLLAIGNQEEIALAKLASERVENEEVKQFAKMMIDDHTKVLQQLQKLAPDAAQQARLSQGEDRVAAQNRNDTATERTASRNAGFDPIEVHKQIAQRCIESARKELADKQGAEADMCYMGQQLVLHQQMIDKQNVFAEYASPELRQAIEEATQGAEKHLEEAKQLVKQISPQASREIRENRTSSKDAGLNSRENRSDSGSSQAERKTERRQPAGSDNR
jgi:predicted outer membrane protein